MLNVFRENLRHLKWVLLAVVASFILTIFAVWGGGIGSRNVDSDNVAWAARVGGQVIGIGETLTEEIIYDHATGVPLNFNWIDYKIPTMADMPDIDPVLLEVWRGGGEYGACGIGEGTLTCTPRAVANAIYNAIGVRVDEIPITPQKILLALGKV